MERFDKFPTEWFVMGRWENATVAQFQEYVRNVTREQAAVKKFLKFLESRAASNSLTLADVLGVNHENISEEFKGFKRNGKI